METSQEPPQDLAIYLGLQGFEVESVEIVEAPRPVEPGRRIKVVHLLRRSGLHLCSACGKGHREELFEEFQRIRFRDCSIGDFETFLEVRAMRVACCGGTRVERLPFAMEGFRMTRRFFERVAALCTKLADPDGRRMGAAVLGHRGSGGHAGHRDGPRRSGPGSSASAVDRGG